jgi:hypothetical protein
LLTNPERFVSNAALAAAPKAFGAAVFFWREEFETRLFLTRRPYFCASGTLAIIKYLACRHRSGIGGLSFYRNQYFWDFFSFFTISESLKYVVLLWYAAGQLAGDWAPRIAHPLRSCSTDIILSLVLFIGL